MRFGSVDLCPHVVFTSLGSKTRLFCNETSSQVIGVKLTGKLSGWTSPKDVILKVKSGRDTQVSNTLIVRGLSEDLLCYSDHIWGHV